MSRIELLTSHIETGAKPRREFHNEVPSAVWIIRALPARTPGLRGARTQVRYDMERRKFVVGLGALASGTAAAVGTGAFTSVEADRQVDVQVAEDANAFLGLDNSGAANDEYFDTSGDEYAVDFASTGAGGSGVNPNADTVAEDVFMITNQGTQPVEVDLSASGDLSAQDPGSISAPSSDGINVALASDDGDSDGTYELGTGDSVNVDFAINSGTSDLSGTLTISADA